MNCMAVPPRIGPITLACRDIERMVGIFEKSNEQFWGGGFSRRDPEGNLWDVAWADGSTFDDRGGLVFP
jgi:hypothetical protein